MRCCVALVLVVACSGGKTKDSPKDAAPAVVAIDAAPAPPLSTKLSDRSKVTLGELELELEPTGSASGPGGSMAMHTLTIRRGAEALEVGLSASTGGEFGDHDRDSEILAFGRLLLLDDDQGLSVTLLPGPAPTELDTEAAVEMLATAAAEGGWSLGDLRGDGIRIPPAGHNGLLTRRVKDGGRLIWTGKVGLFTRRVTIEAPSVWPAPRAGAVILAHDATVKLRGGFTANLQLAMPGIGDGGEHPMLRLTIAKGGQTFEEWIRETSTFPINAELVAFDRLFVVEPAGRREVAISIVAGKPPAEVADGLALADQVAHEHGWPAHHLGAKRPGMFHEQPGIQTFAARGPDGALRWVGRVGRFTRRVWITRE